MRLSARKSQTKGTDSLQSAPFYTWRTVRHRGTFSLRVDPVNLLELGTRPTLLLSRPRDWRVLSDVCETLLEAVSSI